MKADLDNPPAILLTASAAAVPAVMAARGPHAGRRFVEFFTANIRDPNTRKAGYRVACEFFDWCDQARLGLLDIEPVHVAAWVEILGQRFSPPTVKQWLAAVRGPKYVVRTSKTPVLAAAEARQLLDSRDTKTVRLPAWILSGPEESDAGRRAARADEDRCRTPMAVRISISD